MLVFDAVMKEGQSSIQSNNATESKVWSGRVVFHGAPRTVSGFVTYFAFFLWSNVAGPWT